MRTFKETKFKVIKSVVKPKSEIKYYTIDYAIKMLPLIISYCKDLEKINEDYCELVLSDKKLENLITADSKSQKKIDNKKQEIKDKISLIIDRAKRWREELDKLSVKICSVKLGRINIPIFDDATQRVIYICINKSTNKDNVEWHCIEENSDNTRPFYFKSNPDNDLDKDTIIEE